ncbi:hypothetical protein BOTBODRAFT_148102 [Botryobasidium botryosum FD-172 SS1]|uniref:Potassium transport protein n=1 Tax=Botryobasidium botryosum (strain FD-172 SS1) TaxID=930990 RepID=A0A067MC95_BOTB1|nr:hypothetical protein BOTBODRAFT_148102 [Botryobasidium botryosum FD-172 SS1]
MIPKLIVEQANFYRIHVVAFILLPLIGSGIFYGANGEFPISFLDSLFMCYSAMTQTGLATVNMSTLTGFQQCILFILMMIGDTTVVSMVMILVRKYYFRTRCQTVVRTQPNIFHRTMSRISISSPVAIFPLHRTVTAGTTRAPATSKPTLIKDMSDPPSKSLQGDAKQKPISDQKTGSNALIVPPNINERHHVPGAPYDEKHLHPPLEKPVPVHRPPPSSTRVNLHALSPITPTPTSRSARIAPGVVDPAEARRQRHENYFPRTGTMMTSRSHHTVVSLTDAKETGHGGFPGPASLIAAVLRWFLPRTWGRLERNITMPRTTTYNSLHVYRNRLRRSQAAVQDQSGKWSKAVSWLSFDGLVVGRNSNFRTDALSSEQLEEIGGTEYRALKFLSWFIPVYFIGTQILSFLIFAPYLIASPHWDSVFQAQFRVVPKAWFSVFQVMSSYTSCGLSLADESMIPFETMYPMIFSIMFTLLAGKQGLPIALRVSIWLCTKIVPSGSRINETLQFLLDHPRRCFVYLFPSHQTWFLFAILVLFSALEWSCFFVLDKGLGALDSLPIGVRVVAGLFQGLASRASGFSIVNVSALAPSLLVLYVVLMYVAVYPIAISIRSTNVYEETSLGIFESPPDQKFEEPELEGSPGERVGKYLGWHVRRQLANDVWWLVGGIWLVCVIERDSLVDPDNASWFNIFRIVFEMVAAYSGVGLSLGIPTQNYSFSGALRKLSKIIVMVLMVRGRHRELPLAIDRAIMLPHEFNKAENEKLDEDDRMPRSTTL